MARDGSSESRCRAALVRWIASAGSRGAVDTNTAAWRPAPSARSWSAKSSRTSQSNGFCFRSSRNGLMIEDIAGQPFNGLSSFLQLCHRRQVQKWGIFNLGAHHRITHKTKKRCGESPQRQKLNSDWVLDPTPRYRGRFRPFDIG